MDVSKAGGREVEKKANNFQQNSVFILTWLLLCHCQLQQHMQEFANAGDQNEREGTKM